MKHMMQTNITGTADVKANLRHVQSRIAAAAARARRNPADITLVAVTKSGTLEQIGELPQAGCRSFGESRVQQLQSRAADVRSMLEKSGPKLAAPDAAALPGAGVPVQWHMIGHLQTNKASAAVTHSHLIHSVDSLRLIELLGDIGVRRGIQVPILLEINTTDDPNKFGMAPSAAFHMAEEVADVPGLKFMGLMTMARHSKNPADARPAFVRLRELFEDIAARKIGGEYFKHLSMGMSGDFEIAIEEGATIVRVGSALFEPCPAAGDPLPATACRTG